MMLYRNKPRRHFSRVRKKMPELGKLKVIPNQFVVYKGRLDPIWREEREKKEKLREITTEMVGKLIKTNKVISIKNSGKGAGGIRLLLLLFL